MLSILRWPACFLNNTRESGIEEANAIVNEFARSQVFSYYKRMAPTGYAAMISKIGRGEIDVAQMVKDVQNGTSTQDYGMNISYLSFDLQERGWLNLKPKIAVVILIM